MAEEKKVPGTPEESTRPQITQERTPRTPGPYKGPKPAPLISNLPGDVQRYRADELPVQHIPFVQGTVPAAKDWW